MAKKGEGVMIKEDWYYWRKLMFYFEHQLSEEEITETTYDEMLTALMHFKPPLEE